MMSLTRGFAFCLLLQALFSLAPALADQFRYSFPQNITLILEESSAASPRTLTARLKSRLGTLTNLKVFFTSSPDIRIEGTPDTVKDLEPGKEQKFSVTLVPTKKSPDEMGTWVRMGIKYLPDYEALRTAVSSTKTYPVDYARESLLQTVQRNQKKNAVYTEATRLFLSPQPAPLR